jgi:hypothetical protein
MRYGHVLLSGTLFRLWSVDVTKSFRFIRFGDIHGPTRKEFKGSRAKIILHTPVLWGLLQACSPWDPSRPGRGSGGLPVQLEASLSHIYRPVCSPIYTTIYMVGVKIRLEFGFDAKRNVDNIRWDRDRLMLALHFGGGPS